jgi:hypothetical protein
MEATMDSSMAFVKIGKRRLYENEILTTLRAIRSKRSENVATSKKKETETLRQTFVTAEAPTREYYCRQNWYKITL